MRILVLGGTLFLGRHLVDAALAQGHEVTLFNRGTRDVAHPGVELLRGDRDGGLHALAGRRWEAVVDTSGYVPRLVGASSRLLADAVEHYTFVSSASVYRDTSRSGTDEHAPLRTIEDETSEDVPTHYGALKALSERAAEAALPGRVLHVRAGLIVGPFDPTGRFAYWLRRVAAGGEILAPGDPSRAIQLVHARDLADWIIAMAEARTAGVYNAAGPANRLTMGALLDACAEDATGFDVRLNWVEDAYLVANDVKPFTELPLWLPPSDAGLLQLDVSRAIGDGLAFRSIPDTIRDTRAWLRQPAAAPATKLASGVATQAGLTTERERALLDGWRARSTSAAA